MDKETNAEPPEDDMVEFASEVRQIGMEIITAVEEGRLGQVKELATYLCMAATLIEMAGQEVIEIDPYDLAHLKVFRDNDVPEIEK